MRGIKICSHIADTHFGAIDPKKQFAILKEQYLNEIYKLPTLHFICVDGDLFDHKVMSNSDTAYYASIFVDQLVQIARDKGSTLILLHGTYSHDADQLKLFYHYLHDDTVDVRIVTDISYVYAQDCKMLCIPELYDVEESRYREFLFGSYYDMAIVHGTIHGAVYGDTCSSRLFHIEDFDHCMGPIIAGHVHKPGCFGGHWYYCGTPIRYKFGEEEEKGHLIAMMDLDNMRYSVDFLPITSYSYTTIELDTLYSTDPRIMIDYIDKLKKDRGIDYIKIRFTIPVDGTEKSILANHYRSSRNTYIEFLNQQEKIIEEKKQLENSKYQFLTDDTLSEEQKFCQYVNLKEGSEIIIVDQLKAILERCS